MLALSCILGLHQLFLGLWLGLLSGVVLFSVPLLLHPVCSHVMYAIFLKVFFGVFHFWDCDGLKVFIQCSVEKLP